MSHVDVILEDPRWAAAGLERLAEQAVTATLGHVGLAEGWEVAILACNDARISELNAGFRGKAAPTNVLSWPSAERGATEEGAVPSQPDPQDAPELGDLALAYETTVREASEAGLSLADHATHLLVHGTLHLLGYDHVRDGDGDLMESLEIDILAGLGLANPYAPQKPDHMD